ncbi:MAG: AAA family ATPase [Chromatiales bacterium]|nr:AAA family ATPase [Chromatiales bacterium]
MPAQDEHRRWNVTRLELQAWRNFSRQTEIHLGGRAFFIGPNASGKSNILDALRFLRDVAGDGLQGAVAVRGGMSEIRSLHTRRFPVVRIAVDVGSREQPARWSYELHFRVHPQKHVPVIEGERVSRNGETILERPDDKDREDAERLTQTHLEQVSENQKFRVLGRFFLSVRYLHIVPHVVREFRRDGDYRDDPFGSDFLERIAATNKRSRESRLKRIQEALRAAVPQFEKIELERDLTGDWHLYADYKHWRPKAARQNEATFSDGTLRLLGLLWSLAEQGGPLLLEEPELSLHDALVSRLAPIMARMNRKTGRQVLVTTHSVALLRDRGIDLREIHLLDPGEEGTIVRSAAALEDVAALIEQGFSPGEAIMPRAAARDVNQLSLSF